MSSWMSNLLVVKGSQSRINAFIRKHICDSETGEVRFDFMTFDPCPEELLQIDAPNTVNPADMLSKYGASDWYDWCCSHWGCKWNASSVSYNLRPNVARIYFETPWDCPEGIIELIASMYPDLHIDYYYSDESCLPIMGHAGHVVLFDGELNELCFEKNSKELFGIIFALHDNRDDYAFNPVLNTYVRVED